MLMFYSPVMMLLPILALVVMGGYGLLKRAFTVLPAKLRMLLNRFRGPQMARATVRPSTDPIVLRSWEGSVR